jgi:site-specific DNA-methyltransferase (adenine-specific)
MACRIEDGGFEIRDMLAWLYGSGFPKSHNGEWGGTALKPALEPITMARKPLVGTVAANMLAHGTGGLNIDGCRVPLIDGEAPAGSGDRRGSAVYAQDEWTRTQMANGGNATPAAGRWPANLITDGSPEVVALFPATTSGGGNKNTSNRDDRNAYGKGLGKGKGRGIGGDTGSAARFFYCAQQDDSLPRKGCYNAACQDQNPTPSGAATAASSLSLQSLLDATVQSAAATWPSLGGILSSGST